MDNRDIRDPNDAERHDSTRSDFVSHENTGGEQVLGTGAGAAVGAAWGTLAGPIGTIIGGLAGAVGGWWAARSATEQHLFDVTDDEYYRGRHESQNASSSSNRYSYDDVRPAYQMGHLAGANPDYGNRSFDEVEPHLRGAYTSAGQNNWDDVRGYASEGYMRGRDVAPNRMSSGTSGMETGLGTGIGAGMSTADREHNIRQPGGVVDRIGDAADDLKDRVDGNPASRPGRDATDSPNR